MMQMLGFRGGGSSSSSSSSPKDNNSSSPGSLSRNPNPLADRVTGDGSAGPARPLRLVYCDEKGKFQMAPEAVAMLHLVKGPIGVVSVCGRARQGKSFILNQVCWGSHPRFAPISWRDSFDFVFSGC